MKRVSKALSIMLALVIIAGVFGACANQQQVGQDEEKKTEATTAGEATTKEKEKDSPPVTLAVEIFDRGNQGYAPVDNNFLTKFVNEKFGKPNNINVQFVACPRSEESQKLNVWMASAEAPDLVMSYDTTTFINYAMNGGLIDLGPDLEKYGQKLKEYLGEDVLDFGRYNGKQYSIPGKRTKTGLVASAIRKDWLDKLDMPVPETTDEWYNTMKAFKEKDPGGLGGDCIPFGVSMGDITWGYFGMLYNYKHPESDQQFRTTIDWNLPGYKEGYKFLNKLYNEGLMSSEFGLDKDSKKLAQNIATGKVGFYTQNLGFYLGKDQEISSLYKNVPGAEIAACDPFTNDEGKHLKLGTAPRGLYVFVPKFSEHSAEVVKYLNWRVESDEAFTTLQLGIEGTHYEMVNGIPAAKDGDFEKVVFKDYFLVSEDTDYGDPEKYVAAESQKFPKELQDVYLKQYEQAHTDMVAMTVGLVTMPLIKNPNTVVAKYASTLREKFETMNVKLIMCKPSEFDGLYDELVEDYMNAGGREIEEEAKRIYED